MRGSGIVTAAALALAAGTASAQVSQRAHLVIKVGDVFGARTVSTLNTPFTNNNGQAGLVVAFDDATRGIFFDNGFIFNSSDLLPDTATGGEGTMGISDAGGFIYSPSFNGFDAVVTQGGKLLADEDVFPPDPTRFAVFNSRPTMIANGTAYWVCGTSTTAGGSTSNRHFVKATDATDPASISVIIAGGTVIEGKAISMAASNFVYDISDSGAHHVHVLDMVTGSSTNNVHVYVDGAFVMQESLPTGDGDNWEGFGDVSINDNGDYLVNGDTNGATTSDAYLALNADIKIREGGTVGGITLGTGAVVRNCSINNDGHAAYVWGWGSGTTLQEHLFYGKTGDLPGSWRLVSVGGGIDFDGDNVADYTVTDIETPGSGIGPGLDLGESGFVFVEVSMTNDGGTTEVGAILKVPVCPADYNADGFVDGIDYDLFNNDFEAGDPKADFNDDGFVDGIDYDMFNNIFEPGC